MNKGRAQTVLEYLILSLIIILILLGIYNAYFCDAEKALPEDPTPQQHETEVHTWR